MGRYVLRRLLIAIPTLIVISFVVYAILALAPTDPLASFGADPRVPPEVRERIRESLGLNQPWHIRYVKWVIAIAHLDFGYSFMSRSPVMDLIWQRLPNTLAVVGVAYVIGVLLAVPIGMISAVRRYSVFDHLSTTFAFIGFSVPTFFTGLLLIIIFSVKLHWLPFIYDSTLKITSLSTLGDQIRQSIMPITVLALFQAASMTRYVRSSVLEVSRLDYVTTARAKGLPERVVVIKHIVRNALIPVVTLVALQMPALFGGAIVTEQIFRIPGIGSLLISSILANDTPVIMAVTFVFACLVILFNLLADVLYGWLDPRIAYR